MPAAKVDYGLRLYHEVFKLDALHFGWWEPGEALTIDNLRLAQQRYTQHLLDLIPAGTRRILDVGCGTGATAVQLQERGFAVECLTPDAYQIEVFRQKRGGQIPLHQARFEDFAAAAPFDLVLMSESVQYVPPPALFAAAKRNLVPGGALLVSDYFRLQPTPYYKTCHVYREFLDQAAAAGLALRHEQEITERVLPTLALGDQVYRGYVIPILEIVAGLIEQKAPHIKRFVTFAWRKKIAKLQWYLYEKNRDKLDVDKFRAAMRYAMLRFELPAATR